MLAAKWSILHKHLPPNLHITKAEALVPFLCILRNFCSFDASSRVSDSVNILLEGGSNTPESSNFSGDTSPVYRLQTGFVSEHRVDDLLDGGDNRSGYPNLRSVDINPDEILRTKMLDLVASLGYKGRLHPTIESNSRMLF